jgi:hypothetical protein
VGAPARDDRERDERSPGARILERLGVEALGQVEAVRHDQRVRRLVEAGRVGELRAAHATAAERSLGELDGARRRGAHQRRLDRLYREDQPLRGRVVAEPLWQPLEPAAENGAGLDVEPRGREQLVVQAERELRDRVTEVPDRATEHLDRLGRPRVRHHREPELERGDAAQADVVGGLHRLREVVDPGGLARPDLAGAEREHDAGAVGCRRPLRQRATEIHCGGVGGAAPHGLAGGPVEHLDHPGVVRRVGGEEMRGGPVRRRAGGRQELGGAAMQRRALAGGQPRVHRRADDLVRELERRAGLEQVRGGQLVGARVQLVRRQPGQLGGVLPLGARSQHRHGLRERARAGAEASQAAADGARDLVRAERLHAGGVGGGRVDLAL